MSTKAIGARNTEKLLDFKFIGALLHSSLPLMLAAALSYGIGLSDSLMLAAVGEEEVGAISAGVQIQNLIATLSLGFDAAILLLCAQYSGAGDKSSALSRGSLGLILSLGFGLLTGAVFFIFPEFFVSLLAREEGVVSLGSVYLRTVAVSFPFFSASGALAAILKSEKRVGTVFISSLIALGVKLGLNFLFIPSNMLGLGASGAALSTVFARIAELAFLTVALLVYNKESLKGKWRTLLPARSAVSDFLRYGTPLLLSQLVWAINLFYSASVMGRYGKGLVSALGIANTLNTLSAVVTSGIAGGAAILLSREIGLGRKDRIKCYTRSSEITFLILGILVGLIIIFCRTPFVSLYSVSSETKDTALSLLSFLAFLAPVTGYQSAAMLGLIKSGGDVRFVLLTEAAAVFLIIIPLSLLAVSLSVTPIMLFISLKADGLPKCIFAFRRLRCGSYPKSITKNTAIKNRS